MFFIQGYDNPLFFCVNTPKLCRARFHSSSRHAASGSMVNCVCGNSARSATVAEICRNLHSGSKKTSALQTHLKGARRLDCSPTMKAHRAVQLSTRKSHDFSPKPANRNWLETTAETARRMQRSICHSATFPIPPIRSHTLGCSPSLSA